MPEPVTTALILGAGAYGGIAVEGFFKGVGGEVAKDLGKESYQTIKKLIGLGPVENDAFNLIGLTRTQALISQTAEILEQLPTPLTDHLTTMEKVSPDSGFNKTLRHYITTPFEDKLDLLRNALINGMIGDQTLEIREQFYRAAEIIQPFDLQVLRHLVSICSSITYYESTRSNTAENQALNRRLSLEPSVSATYENISAKFNEVRTDVMRVSIDRLRSALLIINTTPMAFGVTTPYDNCVPTDIAQPFIQFLSDPRNKALT